jgi:hypothetical protein
MKLVNYNPEVLHKMIGNGKSIERKGKEMER